MHSKSLQRAFLTFVMAAMALFLAACGIDNPTTSYQGYLTDANGARVPDGSYNVTYRLYSAETAGTLAYTENGTLTVENGLFSTSFGGVNLPTDVAAQELWLEVEIEGETLTPRQRLQGAPFAWTLVSGSIIGATEPLSRTLAGQADTGAGVMVVNSQTTGGGHGILGMTLADSANAAGVSGASQADSYGGRFSSQGYRGLRTDTNNTSFYTAAFFGGIGIYVEGNCTGCRTAEIAVNTGSDAISAGEFVAVEGVAVSDEGTPILQVRRATSPDDVIVGVVVSGASGPVMAESTRLDRVDGDVAAGDYMLVGVTGLFKAQLAAGTDAAVGDYLGATAEGATVLASRGDSANGAARVMSAPDADGNVWVMLGGN